jgi:hypothetical protein
MALLTCPDCGGKVSDIATACPHCGRPNQPKALPAQMGPRSGDAKCPHCGRMVTPVVTSVGGGSCSIGRREKWSCPACKRTIHRSGCFVATAVYGDEDIVEVHLLRQFRDQYLRKSLVGRIFIRLYYRLGPCAAALVARFSPLYWAARKSLDVVIRAIELSTSLSRASARADLRKNWRLRKRQT